MNTELKMNLLVNMNISLKEKIYNVLGRSSVSSFLQYYLMSYYLMQHFH